MNKIETWYHHKFSPWSAVGDTRVVAAESAWVKPLKLNKAAKKAGERRRVLCGPKSDLFEDWQGVMLDTQGGICFADGDIKRLDAGLTFVETKPATMQDVRNRLFDLIDSTPNTDWLLPTKHPENIARMMPCNWLKKVGTPVAGAIWKTQWKNRWSLPENLWIGTIVENQQDADERIPHLIRVPAAVQFLYMPLEGPVKFDYPIGGVCHCGSYIEEHSISDGHSPVDMQRSLLEGIDWVIVGGGKEPMHPDWIRSVCKQCNAAGVPFEVGQNAQSSSMYHSEHLRVRIDELKQLRARWLDGKGVPPAHDGLDWLADSFDSNYPDDVPLPYLFPTPDGRMLAEWSLKPWLPSLEIDLATKRADWHACNLDTDDWQTKELDLTSPDVWKWLADQIRTLATEINP